MSSPFDFFRHHRILTVVLLGLAMFSFVIFGAITTPEQVPPGLWVLAAAAIVGGVGWIVGLRQQKSNEYGVLGLLLGAVVGVAVLTWTGPTDAVLMAGGNLSEQELQTLARKRAIANQFLRSVYVSSGGTNNFEIQNYLFDYDPTGELGEEQSLVIGEILRREGDRLGIVVSDAMVNEYLKALTSNRISQEDVAEARRQLRLSESEVYDALREQIKARYAQQFLYGPASLPPETYFDFYRKLNERRTASVVAIPVDDFIDADAEPSDAELQQLFAQYQANFPNFTPEGRPEEGRPGFVQPRRVQLGYVEAAYEQIKETVPAPTEEEIKQYYQENYVRPVEEPAEEGAPPEEVGPGLAPPAPQPAPNPQATQQGDDDSAPAGEEATPDAADSAPPEPASEAEGDASEDESGEVAEPEEPQAPADESEDVQEAAPSSAAPEESESSLNRRLPLSRTGLTPVAFLQQEAAQEPAADDGEENRPQSTSRAPAPDLPADAADGQEDEPAAPADEPAESSAPSQAETPTDAPPAAPAEAQAPEAPGAPAADAQAGQPSAEPAAVPELDDVREEIIENMIRERTFEKMQQLVEAARDKMALNYAYALAAPEESEESRTYEEVADELRAYARENNLLYVETPFLSYREMLDSDDHPIGNAFDRQAQGTVADAVFRTSPDLLYQPGIAVDLQTNSQFAYWKIGEEPQRVPQDMSDERVRQQVVEAWRKLQALPKAEKRAEEIAAMMRTADQPMEDVLADATITGEEDGMALTVRELSPFAWMSRPQAPSPNPFNPPPPRVTDLSLQLASPNPVGDRFMSTVFNELEPGETGVTMDSTGDTFFVVKVGKPEDAPKPEEFREKFLQEPVFGLPFFSPYQQLAGQLRNELNMDWSSNWRDLMERYDVRFRQSVEEE